MSRGSSPVEGESVALVRAARAAVKRGDKAAALAALAALERASVPDAGEVARARRSYAITHWGERGDEHDRALRIGRCADPRVGVYTKMGDLVSVAYATTKGGDRKSTVYEHDFSRPLPELVYSGGGLVIVGGRYRVTWRGIVD